jgi:23S rRNA (uracil1939-C5)-methyltransferase
VQHLAPAFIAAWKHDRVAAALARAGVAAGALHPTVSIPQATRRRATLAARRAGKRIILGFTERASHRLVDLEECHVLRPELVALVAPLRAQLSALLKDGETADIAVTATARGVDLLLIRQRPLDLADREALAALAESLDLARLSWQPKPLADVEPVSMRRTPAVRMGVHLVPIPSGIFLQPSAEGETELVRLVAEATQGVSGPVVDLFSGLGTFALPLSNTASVSAFDVDREAIAVLAVMNRAIRAQQRDLFREPLTPTELAPFAAAILDPPRAGAQAQAQTLAGSRVPLIVYVSCNPTSFARDAAILIEGGYALDSVTPVDQFLWSAHTELVGVLRR